MNDRTWISRSDLPMGLALLTVVLAVIQPPEAYGDGRMAVILSATFAFLGALGEGQIPARYVWGGLAGLGFLAVHSSGLSIDAYRSLELLTVFWAYFCLAGTLYYSRKDPARPAAIVLVALAAILSVYGIYQYFWGFDSLERLIVYSGSTEIVKTPALSVIADRRVTSTLALPGTLWGVLTMALPFHLVLWSRRTGMNAVLAVLMALSLCAGFLTRSFGLLVGLAAVTVCWFLTGSARAAWRRTLLLCAAAAASGFLFYSARRAAIAAQDPMALRFLNWISAWSVFSTHPLGTGLNTFGIVYTQHMLPNANETQYAHNTILQLLSEIGYPALIAFVAFAAFVATRRKIRAPSPFGRAAACAAAAWAAHNLIDIDLYFPSVAVVGVVAAALWLRGSGTIEPAPQDRARPALIAAIVASVPVLAFAGLTFISTELQHRAQAEYSDRKPLVARETLDTAKRLMPLNSSLFYDDGEIALDLSQRTHNSKDLDAATHDFERAIMLSPQKVGPHIGHGLSLASAGHLEAALAEIDIARHLYPRGREASGIGKMLTARIRRAEADVPGK